MPTNFSRISTTVVFVASINLTVTGTALADTTRPTVPSNAYGITYSPNAAEIFWRRSSDDTAVAFYRVYRGSALVFERNATSYFDTDVQAGASYSYQISAVDTSGNESQRTPIINFVMPGTMAPSASSGQVPAQIENAQAENAQAGNTVNSSTQNQSPQRTQSEPSIPLNVVGVMDSNTFTLSWLASEYDSGEIGYNIYQNGKYMATTFEPVFTGTVGLEGSYDFQVVAFDNSQHYSAKSAIATLLYEKDEVSLPPASDPVVAPQITPNPATVTEQSESDTALAQQEQPEPEQPTPEESTVADSSTDADPSDADSSTSADPAGQADTDASNVDEPFTANPETTPPGEPNVDNVNTEQQSDNSQDNDPTTGVSAAPTQTPTEIQTEAETEEQSADPAPEFTEQAENSAPDQIAVNAAETNSAEDTPSESATSLLPPIINAVNSNEAAALTLQWDASEHPSVEGYNIYRDGQYHSTVFGTSYTDTNLKSGQHYAYQLGAFTSTGGYSELSEPLSFHLDDVTGMAAMVEPLPEPIDPFDSHLELNVPTVRPDGNPTAPRHLRLSLLSNNWAELDWTPAADNGVIVEYRIYRDDGVIYSIVDLQIDNHGAQLELNKYWNTTSFIDCNFTRFYDRVHNCGVNQPEPGATHSYHVTAVDDDGIESTSSNTLEITFYEQQGAEVVPYTDMYLNADDRFPFETDFSTTDNFLDTFELVFEDEFDQASLDLSKWNTSLTWNQTNVINGEQQYFVDTEREPDFGFNPFVMSGDSLLISAIATPESLSEKALGHPFLSGALSSHDKYGFTYGYIEARMKVGEVPGMLSSFYLFRRWAAEHAPEIDIVEYLANNPYGDEEAFETYHYRDPVNDVIRSSPTMSTAPELDTRFGEDFHTFGALWEPGLVIWYIDGVEVKRLSGLQIARQQMNIVLYLVTGSEWTPAPEATLDQYPLQFEIDYVKVFQRAPYIK